ncbi:MAG: hypothetical protein BECKG1743D_GA0114223_103246, partial [Candidatus Kentron sp. G]
KKLLDTFGAQVFSDHERYPADVKCLGFLYLYVGRYPRNNASRNRIRRYGWRDAHVTSIHGGGVIERFVFAHERAVPRAYPISRPEDAEKHTESWRCDVLSGHELAASFEGHVAAHGV